MGFAVRQVQQTPYPHAVKFILDQEIADRPISFFNAESAVGHPVAARLFDIAGVSSVLLLGDFVTINKSPQAKWADIQKNVTLVLAELKK
jgi:nicotinamide mononucleotide (NMN) deamidase PncC